MAGFAGLMSPADGFTGEEERAVVDEFFFEFGGLSGGW